MAFASASSGSAMASAVAASRFVCLPMMGVWTFPFFPMSSSPSMQMMRVRSGSAMFVST